METQDRSIAPDASAGVPSIESNPVSPAIVADSPSILRRLYGFLNEPLPWHGTRPFPRFLQASLIVIVAILLVKAIENAETRLEVYVLDVAVIFFLGFVLLKGKEARVLASKATRADLGIAVIGVAADVLANLGVWSPTGYATSAQPGFADAIALLLILFVAFYGWRNIRTMVAPLSLLIALAAITVFISNEDPTFYTYIGQYFVAFTVWMAGGVLNAIGYSVETGPNYIRTLGTGGIRVGLGIRCGGLDVATVYSLFIGYFAWQTRLSNVMRLGVALAAAVGALLVNGLRVVLITILFLHYPLDVVEAVHTNIGDFIFLGYAAAFILVLARYR